jgi:hypothetical protein
MFELAIVVWLMCFDVLLRIVEAAPLIEDERDVRTEAA